MSESTYDLVIVGAGWYGLIAAATYLRLVPDTKLVLIDDGHSIGGVWNRQRIYPTLFAQVGHGLFEYSNHPMPKQGLSPDRYISGETIHRYLNDVAIKEKLVDKILLDTRVTHITKDTTTPSPSLPPSLWQLHTITKDGAEHHQTLYTHKLIVASGVTSKPYQPDLPRENDFTKPVIHSEQLGSSLDLLAELQTQRVVVLGAAKSAYDTVFTLLRNGKHVDWVIREDGTGPLAIAPPKILGIWNAVDLMGTRMLGALSPAILQTDGPLYYFLQR